MPFGSCKKLYRYILRTYRKYLYEAIVCEDSNCDSLVCHVKKFFNEISLSNGTNSSVIDLEKFFTLVNETYPAEVVVEDTVDALQVFFHFFAKSKCIQSKIVEHFKLNIVEIFKCTCGHEFFCNLSNSVNWMTISITSQIELSESTFFQILKKNTSNSYYKFCKDPKCLSKNSKKMYYLNSSPKFMIFRLAWNISERQIRPNSISISFFTTDVFGCEKVELYSLNLISTIFNDTRIIFYQNQSAWYSTKDDSIMNFLVLKELLSQNKYIVEALVYEKEKKTQEDYNELPKYKTFNVRSQWVCTKCNEKNFEDSKICTKCYQLKPGENGWVCLRCKTYNERSMNECISCDVKFSENFMKKTIDFTASICPKCKNKVKNGTNCQICPRNLYISSSIPIRGSMIIGSSIEKSKKNSLKCQTCAQPLVPPFFCSKCFKRPIGSTCTKCSNSQFICEKCIGQYCEKCHSKKEGLACGKCLQARPKSVKGKSSISCSKCKSSMTPSEHRNCVNCNKKVSKLKCSTCNPAIKVYICDSCMKKIPKK